jgi:hypothetical protein
MTAAFWLWPTVTVWSLPPCTLEVCKNLIGVGYLFIGEFAIYQVFAQLNTT